MCVQWDDFVHGMGDVNFAAKNTGDLSVELKSEGGGEESPVGGKIALHKPHRVSKLDPVMWQLVWKRTAKCLGCLENSLHYLGLANLLVSVCI